MDFQKFFKKEISNTLIMSTPYTLVPNILKMFLAGSLPFLVIGSIVVLILYIKFFHKTRIRFMTFSKLIDLPEHMGRYNSELIELFTNMYHLENNYDDLLKEVKFNDYSINNLYFFKALFNENLPETSTDSLTQNNTTYEKYENLLQILENIDNNIEVDFFKDENNDLSERTLEQKLGIILNNKFRQRFKDIHKEDLNETNAYTNNKLYDALESYVKNFNHHVHYNNYDNLLNFLDVENLISNESINENKLLNAFSEFNDVKNFEKLNDTLNIKKYDLVYKLSNIFGEEFGVSHELFIMHIKNVCGEDDLYPSGVNKFPSNTCNQAQQYSEQLAMSNKFTLSNNGDVMDMLCELHKVLSKLINDSKLNKDDLDRLMVSENIDHVHHTFENIINLSYTNNDTDQHFLPVVKSQTHKDLLINEFQDILMLINVNLYKDLISNAITFTQTFKENYSEDLVDWFKHIIQINDKLTKLDFLLNDYLKRIQEYDKKRNLCDPEIREYWRKKLIGLVQPYKDFFHFITHLIQFKHTEYDFVRDRVVYLGKFIISPKDLIQRFTIKVIEDDEIPNDPDDDKDKGLFNELLFRKEDINENGVDPAILYKKTKLDENETGGMSLEERTARFDEIMNLDEQEEKNDTAFEQQIMNDQDAKNKNAFMKKYIEEIKTIINYDKNSRVEKIDDDQLFNIDDDQHFNKLYPEKLPQFIKDVSEHETFINNNGEKLKSYTSLTFIKPSEYYDESKNVINVPIEYLGETNALRQKLQQYIFDQKIEEAVSLMKEKSPMIVAHALLLIYIYEDVFYKLDPLKFKKDTCNKLLKNLIDSDNPQSEKVEQEDITKLIDIFDYLTYTNEYYSSRIILTFNTSGRILFEIFNHPSTYNKAELLQEYYKINPDGFIDMMLRFMLLYKPLLVGVVADRLTDDQLGHLLFLLFAKSYTYIPRLYPFETSSLGYIENMFKESPWLKEKIIKYTEDDNFTYDTHYFTSNQFSDRPNGSHFDDGDNPYKWFVQKHNFLFDRERDTYPDELWMFHMVLSHVSNEADTWKNNMLTNTHSRYDDVICKIMEQNIHLGAYFCKMFGPTNSESVLTGKGKNAVRTQKNKFSVKGGAIVNHDTTSYGMKITKFGRYSVHSIVHEENITPTDRLKWYPDNIQAKYTETISNENAKYYYMTNTIHEKTEIDDATNPVNFRYYINQFNKFYYVENDIREDDPNGTVREDDTKTMEGLTMLKRKRKKKFWGSLVTKIINNANPFKAILKIFNFFKKIGEFIIELAILAIDILKKLSQLIFKPQKLIKFITEILILCVSLVVSIVGNIKLGGAKGDEIAFRVKHLVAYLGGCFVYFWFYLLLYYSPRVPFYAVFYWIQFYIDIAVYKGSISSFYYKWLDACENPPDDWYTVTGYHEGNKNASNSMIGYKSLTCPQGYKIDNFSGSMCIKKESYEPNMCPQANIYRMYHANLNPTYPLRPLPFSPSSKFANNSTQKRYAELKEYNTKKKEFYDNCSVTMKPYDNVTKNICRNLDTYQGSALKKDELESLCHDTYCGHGNYEAFCYKLNDKYKIKNNDSNKLKHYYNIAWTIVLILSLLYVSNLISNQEFKDWIKANLKQIKNKKM